MTPTRLHRVLGQLRAVAARPPSASDTDLLDRFLAAGDEAAFAELVRRHGPMVLGLCRRLLGNAHDADDAFQATFLVLVRKAQALPSPGCVGPWLFGVARRTALKARSLACRRRQVERAAGAERVHATPTPDGGELFALVDEVIDQLPAKYREPLVLCLVQGRSRKEAAGLLGWTEGTLSGRLARAKELLGDRLRRRGVAPAALAGVALCANVSASLAAMTARTAVVPAAVLTLTEEVLTAMVTAKFKHGLGLLALVVGIGFGTGALAQYGSLPAEVGKDRKTEPKGAARVAGASKPARAGYVIEPPDVLLVRYAWDDDKAAVRLNSSPLVRPDGTIGLGPFGEVRMSGLTVPEAREAVRKQLAGRLDEFDDKKLVVEVKTSNSKVMYVIIADGGKEEVHRFLVDSNKCVVDILAELQQAKPTLVGLGKKRISLLRMDPAGGSGAIYEIDWQGITMHGDAKTNYLMLPGDRLRIENPNAKGYKLTLSLASTNDLTRPTTEEVIRALPKSWADVKVSSITFEVVASEAEPERLYPGTGVAGLVRVNWKCTAYAEGKAAVVYIERHQLAPAK